MWTDPIVEELHRIREEHAASFNYDLWAIAEDLRRIEREWPAPKIDPPPKPPVARVRSTIAPENKEISADAAR